MFLFYYSLCHRSCEKFYQAKTVCLPVVPYCSYIINRKSESFSFYLKVTVVNDLKEMCGSEMFEVKFKGSLLI